MSVVRRHIADGAISPNKLAAANYDGSYFRYVGDHQPICQDGDGLGVPSGLDTGTFIAGFRCGDLLGTYIGGPQAVLNPHDLSTVTGLVITLSADVGFGVEYNPPGFLLGDGPHAIDSDIKDGSFIRFKGSIADVVNNTFFGVGFREAGAVDADYANYAESGYVAVVASGAVFTETNNAGAGVVSVDLTPLAVGDNEEFEATVVFKNGFFRFYFNGVEVGNRVAAEAGKLLVPFVRAGREAGSGTISCKELEFGKLSDLNDEAEW